VGAASCATKEYHTSAPGVPAHVDATFGDDWVFPESVCPVNWLVPVIHVVEDEMEVGAAHMSL
jgi:hypothetical protein